MKFDDINIGTTAQLSHELTENDVKKFVELTGDDNRLHTDRSYSKNTSFKKPVAHGMLGASFISTIIGTKLPGDGALWFSQNLEFLLPVRVGDTLFVTAEVIGKDERSKIIELKTDIKNQFRQVVTQGIAKVKVIEKENDSPDDDEIQNIGGVALVIGASGGIGTAVSEALASKGFDIALHYFNNIESANELSNKLEKKEVKTKVFGCNITDSSEVSNMVDDIVRQLGNISVLVNCSTTKIAAIKYLNLTWDDFEVHLNNQIKGSFNLINAVVPHMEKQKYGKIINIDTQYVDAPEPNLLPYITAKSALRGFSKSLAYDLAPKGIRVNLVSPGMTDTDQIADVPERYRLVTAAKTPLKRLAKPKDIANVIAFLASEESDFICGETIRVNGGQVMI